MAAFILGVFALGLAWHVRQRPAIVPVGLDEKAMQSMGRLGSGFLVWERLRDGVWEIWRKDIRGGEETRLMRNGADEDYFCPKISPDGKRLAFLCCKRGRNAYTESVKEHGSLWVLNMQTDKRRRIAIAARSYAEDRAVTWLDKTRLAFINERGATMDVDFRRGESSEVVHEPANEFGYLPSPDLKFATSGEPEFTPLDSGGVVHHKPLIHGCQPYFTSDSKWGVWMGGAGGPVQVMHLKTREAKILMQRFDGNMPKERNYLYFPMVSPCMRLLAFAASPGEHDHFKANYNIFLVRIDPTKMEVVSKPVRYTDYAGCDRYPDVFCDELPLGSHFVKGATELELSAPDKAATWEWSFGDGDHAVGARVKHLFHKSAEYFISATKHGDARSRVTGYVFVEKPFPPRLLNVQRDGAKTVSLHFNEKVDASKASVEMMNGNVLQELHTTADGHAVTFDMPDDFLRDTAVTLRGFSDCAQHPNFFPHTTISISGSEWPASTNGLCLQWKNQKTANALPGGVEGRLQMHGKAFWSEHGAMQLRGGWFDAPDAGPQITETSCQSDVLTLDMVLTPEPLPRATTAPGVILSLSGSTGAIILSQRGEMLFLNVSHTIGGMKKQTKIELSALVSGSAQHISLRIQGGRVVLYCDGKEASSDPFSVGTVSTLKLDKVRFGAAVDGSSAWRGKIERVLIFGSALKREEVQRHYNAMQKEITARPPMKEWVVRARLAEATKGPTLQEIQPYREALVRQIYDVEKIERGSDPLPGQIAVTQWYWMGGQPMPAQSLKAGDTVLLKLHQSENHQEIGQLFTKDDLITGMTAPRFHDASDWDTSFDNVH